MTAQHRAAETIATTSSTWLAGWAPRLRRAPIAATRKGALAARLLLSDRSLRRLLLAYLRDRRARGSIRLTHLMDDLLRLGIARRVAAGHRRSFRTEVHYDSANGNWTLRSVPIDHAGLGRSCPGGRGRLTQIEWNHAEVGTQLRWGRRREVVVRMGSDGRHSFEALVQLASRHVDRVWDALSMGCARSVLEPDQPDRERVVPR